MTAEQNVKTQSAATGPLATLSALLCSASAGVVRPPPLRLRARRVPALLGGVALALAATLLLGAASALAAAPTVTIQPATEIGFTTAQAKGTVDPAEHNTGYRFDFATQAQWEANGDSFNGAFTPGPGGNLAENSGEEEVEPILENLTAATTYHLRLYAENDQGEHEEAIAASTFTTKAPTAPALAVKAPEPSYLGAHLAATINPEGGNVNPIGPTAVPIAWDLQFSLTGEPGTWASAGGAALSGAQAESNAPIEVQGDATGLTPASHYVTRLVLGYAGLEQVAAEEPGFETLPVAKPTISLNPVEPFTATTAHLSGEINPNAPQAEGSSTPAEAEAFATTYSFHCAPECPGLETHELLAGNVPKEVSVDVSGLVPGLEYKVTLSAANAGGTAEITAADTFTTEAQPPAIDATFATEVGETKATLGAKVNPGGASTTVHFEYITQEQFEVPGPEGGFAKAQATEESGSIGANDEDHLVEVTIEGLEPGTAYRYRVVATNAKSPTGTPGPAKAFHTTLASPPFSGCPNEAIRRQNDSTGLADCRAYELVSPIDKDGFDAYPNNNPTPAQAAPGGDKIAYQSFQAFPGAQGNSALFSAHVSSRTASGWQTTDWTPPAPRPARLHRATYDFSEDLSQAVIKVPLEQLTPEATPYVFNLFLRHPDGTYSWVNAATPKVLPEEICVEPEELTYCYELGVDTSTFAGASADFSQILFESTAQLKAEAPETGTAALYESSEGGVSLVGVLPDEQPAATSTADAISADGSRVVFQAPSDEGIKPAEAGQAGLTEVYDRINGTETVELSAPNPGATPENPAAKPATFWAATPDGSRVFFTSAAELTTQSKTGDEGGEDLYEYDFNKPASERVSDLSVGSAPHGARVLGVVNPSADGSYIYFVAKGQLDGTKGTEGKPNLYMAHEGEAPVFITTLGDGDALNAYVTADGKHLAFMSALSLETENFPAGYDNTDQNSGGADSEVYEWSAQSGEVICASCDPSGKRPFGSAVIGSSAAQTPFFRMRSLSENGARLFYTAPGRRGIPSAQVYEYERSGEGSCTNAGGCHYLISDPAAEESEVFLGASADGRDVFLATQSRLVPGDEDNLIDVYDARAGGGFAVTPPTPPCEGEGCRGPGSSALPSPSAGTRQFAGPEEGPNHLKCAKHQIKRHARCVSRKHKSRHHHRSHKRVGHNRGGSR